MSDTKTYCAKAQGTSKHAWLFDYTNDAISHGANINDASTYGYWTSTPISKSPNYIWKIGRDGYLCGSNAGHSDSYGLRPVVTVQKSVIE